MTDEPDNKQHQTQDAGNGRGDQTPATRDTNAVNELREIATKLDGGRIFSGKMHAQAHSGGTCILRISKAVAIIKQLSEAQNRAITTTIKQLQEDRDKVIAAQNRPTKEAQERLNGEWGQAIAAQLRQINEARDRVFAEIQAGLEQLKKEKARRETAREYGGHRHPKGFALCTTKPENELFAPHGPGDRDIFDPRGLEFNVGRNVVVSAIFATEDILAAAMYGVPTDPPDFYKPRISTIISGILVIIFIPFIIINGVCAYSKKGDNKEKNAKKIYKRFMLVEMVLVVVCMLLLFIFRNLYLIQMGDYNEELEGLENYILAVEILGGIICIANIIWNDRKIIKKIGNEIKNSPLILFEILVLIILPMIMINMDILSLFTSFNDRDLIYNSFADVGCVLIVVIVLAILFRIWRKPKKYSDELLEKNANRKNITMIMGKPRLILF